MLAKAMHQTQRYCNLPTKHMFLHIYLVRTQLLTFNLTIFPSPLASTIRHLSSLQYHTSIKHFKNIINTLLLSFFSNKKRVLTNTSAKTMTSKQAFLSCFLLIIFTSYHFTTSTLAQSPAQAPSTQDHPSQTTSPTQAPTSTFVPLVQAPPAKAQKRAQPTNVTEILEKAGGFSIFIRLLHSTDVITQIENNLNASNSVTILAPTNGGFSVLKPGTLNTLSPQQKTHLIEFHVIPTFIALQNFQTLTNPIHTHASNTRDYPLNVITDGNSVNISTGVINTTISGTVYSDNQLAIYRIDSVLLPKAIFAPKVSSLAPAPAPAALKPKKESSSSSSSSSTASASSTGSSSSSSSKPSSVSTADATAAEGGSEGPVADQSDISGVMKSTNGNGVMAVGVAVFAAVFMLSWFDRFAWVE